MLTLLLGIILGLLWTFFNCWLFLRIAKIKCPQCKQLKPIKEIILFHWKNRIITGKPCLKCQRPKPQIAL